MSPNLYFLMDHHTAVSIWTWAISQCFRSLYVYCSETTHFPLPYFLPALTVNNIKKLCSCTVSVIQNCNSCKKKKSLNMAQKTRVASPQSPLFYTLAVVSTFLHGSGFFFYKLDFFYPTTYVIWILRISSERDVFHHLRDTQNFSANCIFLLRYVYYLIFANSFLKRRFSSPPQYPKCCKTEKIFSSKNQLREQIMYQNDRPWFLTA